MDFVCNDPGVLQGIYVVRELIKIAYIIAPIILVVRISIDVFKEVINKGEDFGKTIKGMVLRFIALAIMILFIPLYNGILEFASIGDEAYTDCFTNSNPETIAALSSSASILDALTAVSYTEASLSRQDYEEANLIVERLADTPSKEELRARLDKALVQIERIENMEDYYYIVPSTSVTAEYGDISPSMSTSAQRDPMQTVRYYSSIVSESNFTYMSDENGKDLGIWPKNYNEIPTGLSSVKTYPKSTSFGGTTFSSNTVGDFIWPLTPVDGVYNFVYEHGSLDIMAPFGSPVYSPVSGTLVYSEYGHTGNTGFEETPYSIKITLDEAITIGGSTIQNVFMTHFSGLVYNCSSVENCNRTIQKGELIGFVGNAAGTAESLGWAPHLHITVCLNSGCGTGITTSIIEDAFEISSGTARKAGE